MTEAFPVNLVKFEGFEGQNCGFSAKLTWNTPYIIMVCVGIFAKIDQNRLVFASKTF